MTLSDKELCGVVRGEGRASRLQTKYQAKPREYDTRHHDTRQGETGPLVGLLESYGRIQALVVGPWGNGSDHLHDLVRMVAECRVTSKDRALGNLGLGVWG